jgi:hypothetical protein
MLESRRMSTFYDDFMRMEGTNSLSTNVDFQIALSNLSKAYENQEKFEMIQRAGLVQRFEVLLFHAAILVLATVGIILHWNISRSMKRKSEAGLKQSDVGKNPPDAGKP